MKRIGYNYYGIHQSMLQDIDSIWQAFWADTEPAYLEIAPRTSGYYELDATAVTCSGSAAAVPKVIRGHRGSTARLFSSGGSLTYEGSAAPGGTHNVIDIDGLSVDNIDLTFRNLNYGRIVNTRLAWAQFVTGPYNGGSAQNEFNEFSLELSNAPNDAIYFLNNGGDNSMRGTRLFATVSGSEGNTAFRMACGAYQSTLEVHANGCGAIQTTSPTGPTGNPIADGYTAADATFRIEESAGGTPDLIGSHVRLKTESGRTNAVELWMDKTPTYLHEDMGFLEVNMSGWNADYIAVTDLTAEANLPPYRFTDSLDGVPYKWAEQNGGWSSTAKSNT